MNNNHETLPIIRAKFGELTLYEISESELCELSKGSPESLHLNFAISLFSIAVSFLIALLTTDINSIKIFTVFVVITVIGFIISGILFVIWLKSYRSTSKLVNTIRRRLPPKGIQEGGFTAINNELDIGK